MSGVGTYLEADSRSWATIFTDYLPIVKYSAFYLDGENIWFDSKKTNALGSNVGSNNRIATNKTKRLSGILKNIPVARVSINYPNLPLMATPSVQQPSAISSLQAIELGSFQEKTKADLMT